MRRHRLGLLLQPAELDGDLLGVVLPRRPLGAMVPGRGYLVRGATSSSTRWRCHLTASDDDDSGGMHGGGARHNGGVAAAELADLEVDGTGVEVEGGPRGVARAPPPPGHAAQVPGVPGSPAIGSPSTTATRSPSRCAARGPLVLVHGFSAEGMLYAQSLWRLVDMGFKVVAIDTAGHGGTQGLPTGGGDFAAYSALLGRVLDALGIQQAVLAGHSMGGRLVTQLRRRTPSGSSPCC